MSAFYHSQSIPANANKVQLVILSNSHTKLKRGLRGHVQNPTYSFLYYMLDGELAIHSKEGTDVSLTKENCYLFPAGYSFDYTCNSFAEYVAFHIKLCNFDGIDVLQNCGEPLAYSFPPEMADSYISLVHSSDITGNLKMGQEIYNSLFTLFDKYRISLKNDTYSLQIQNAVNYINSNLSIQLTIDGIASNTFTTPSTLTRNFRKETGMTVSQYIDRAVMSRAEEMLLSTEKSVLEISEFLGFCDQSYFARRFKAAFGVTPRDYKHTTPSGL